MAITQAMCTSFKYELLRGYHAFDTTFVRSVTTADTFKIALYTSTASLGADTTAYTTSGEVVGTGYTAGGKTLTVNSLASAGTTAFLDFADVTWTAATLSSNGALIYNSSWSNRAVAVLNFGSTKTCSGGNFVIQFPVADETNAILRIA